MSVDTAPGNVAMDMTCPDGWDEAPLSSVAETRFSNVDKKSAPGERPVRLCNYTDVYNNDYITDDMEFMRATATRPEIDRFGLIVGDVVITKDSETPDDIGVPTVVDSAGPDLVCGYHLAMLRPDQSKIDPTFLAKQLSHWRIARYFGQHANGSTRYGLSTGAIAATLLHLPRLEQQQQISRIVRLVDAAIGKTAAVIGKLKQVRAGLLHDLLTRGLDQNGQLRDPTTNPHQFKPSPLGNIPKEWDAAPVSVVADTFAGGTPPRSASGMFGGTIPWVKSSEVNLREITETEEKLTTHGFLASSTKWIDAGTPLVALYGATAGVVGWLAIRAVTNQAVLAIVPRTPDADKRWLYWVLQFRRSNLLAIFQGSGQPNLSKSIVDSLLLPVAPADEQAEIARRLDRLQQKQTTEEAELAKLHHLKAGLMSDLLTGRVRVPADLNVNTHPIESGA